jgi:hypothetical protein
MNKELCDCGKMAVWDYMPGYSGGGNSYSCDDCVHRGCSCNYGNILDGDESGTDEPEGVEGKDFIWIDDSTWTSVDENGKESPCAEYWYSEEGWEVENE